MIALNRLVVNQCWCHVLLGHDETTGGLEHGEIRMEIDRCVRLILVLVLVLVSVAESMAVDHFVDIVSIGALLLKDAKCSARVKENTCARMNATEPTSL